MASGMKLSMTFTTDSGSSRTMSYNYAKPDLSGQQVKTLMDTIIANKIIFSASPTMSKGAKLVKTEETTFVID